MESLELRIFREVAGTNSISKAAENMGYVQSNVTAHIKKLETELNTTLLVRHNKGVTLTEDGERLLYQAEKIISLLDNTSQIFKNAAKTLNIGTTQTIAGYLLPQCLMEYRKLFPYVSISVHTLQQDTFETQLVNGQLDCIITNSSRRISQGKHIVQFQEKLLLIAPASYKNIENIENLPVITNHIKSCPYREILLNWWNLHYSKIPQIIETDTVESIVHMVEIGGGISLLPESILNNRLNINRFIVSELQPTYIHMWIAKNAQPSEYELLVKIFKKQLKHGLHCTV